MKKAYVTVYAIIITVILFTVIAVLLNSTELAKRNNGYKKELIQAQLNAESDAIEVVGKIDLINQNILQNQYGRHQIISVKGNVISYQLIREKIPKKKYKYNKYIALQTEQNGNIVHAMITFEDKYNLEKDHWTVQEMKAFIEKGVKENNRDTVYQVDYPAVIIGKEKQLYVAHRDQFLELQKILKKEHEEKVRGIDFYIDPEKEEETQGPITQELEEIEIPAYQDDYDRMITETIEGQSVFVAAESLILNSTAEFLGEEPFFKGVLFDNGNIISKTPILVDGVLFIGDLCQSDYLLQKGICITESKVPLKANDRESAIIPKLNAYEEVRFKALSIR